MKYLVNRETKEHRIHSYGEEHRLGSVHGAWDIVEADAEGWIKWEGGECPLPGDCIVNVMLGNGTRAKGLEAAEWLWNCYEHSDYAIKAYRPILDKPEVIKTIPAPDYDPRSVSFNVLKRLESAHESAQKIPDLEAELRDVLGRMGYDLVSRSPFVDRMPLTKEQINMIANFTDPQYPDEPLPDMNDWRNWRVGDLIECVNDEGWSAFKKEGIYIVTGISKAGAIIVSDNLYIGNKHVRDFRFHSRPEAS